MPADRRVPLTRDRVLRAAISLADDGGIGSLAMRKLGQALGVEAMSLYKHVASKDDLLDGIADHILNQIDLPAAADWETAIWQCAVSAHATLAAHPWACNLIMSIPRPLPARLRYMDSVLRCLRQAGFSAAATYHGYHALDSHILGFTLWEAGHAIKPEEIADLKALRTAPHRDRPPGARRVRVRAPADHRRPQEDPRRPLTGAPEASHQRAGAYRAINRRAETLVVPDRLRQAPDNGGSMPPAHGERPLRNVTPVGPSGRTLTRLCHKLPFYPRCCPSPRPADEASPHGPTPNRT